jgi:hypothetical protein
MKTGYRGRMGICDNLIIDDDIKNMILKMKLPATSGRGIKMD